MVRNLQSARLNASDAATSKLSLGLHFADHFKLHAMRHKRHQPVDHEAQTKLVDGDQLARHHRIITVLRDAFCRCAITFDKARVFKICRLGKLSFYKSGREYSRRNTFAAKFFIQRLAKAIDEGLNR